MRKGAGRCVWGGGNARPLPQNLGARMGKMGRVVNLGEKDLGAWDSHALSPALGHIARSRVPGNWD